MNIALSMFLLLFSAFGGYAQQQEDSGRKALELYWQSDFAAAIPLFENAFETNKEDPKLWTYYGMSLAKTGKDKEAVKALLKAYSMPDKDPLVFDTPLKVISKQRGAYTDKARRNSTVGVVKVAAEFNASGKVTTVIPLNKLRDGLTESAIDAAQHIIFEPAIVRGKPVSVIRFIEYHFDL